MEDKLCEIEKCELIGQGYKYEIVCYEDLTEITYIEKDSNNKWSKKTSNTIPSVEDIQICEKIIEMRKRLNLKNEKEGLK